MYTQCPDCTSVFEISPEHLGAAGGMVRCGICDTTFNALRRLTESPPTDGLSDQSDSETEASPTDETTGGDQPGVLEKSGEEQADTIAESPENTASDESPEAITDAQAWTEDEAGESDDDHPDETGEDVPVNPDDLFSTSQTLDDWDTNEGEQDLKSVIQSDADKNEQKDEKKLLEDPAATLDDLFDGGESLDKWDLEEGEHDLQAALESDELADDEFVDLPDDPADDDTDEQDSDLDNQDEAVEKAIVNPDDIFSTSQVLEEWDIDEGEHDLEELLADESLLKEAGTDAGDGNAADSDDELKADDTSADASDAQRNEDSDKGDPFGEPDSETRIALSDDSKLNPPDETEVESDDYDGQDEIDQDGNPVKRSAEANKQEELDDSESDDPQQEPENESDPDGEFDSERGDEEALDEGLDPDEQSEEIEQEEDTSDESAEDDDHAEDASDDDEPAENDDHAEDASDDDESAENDDHAEDASDDDEPAENDDHAENTSDDDESAENDDHAEDASDSDAPDESASEDERETTEEPADSNKLLTHGVDGTFEEDYEDDADDLKDLGHYLSPTKSIARHLGEGLVVLLLLGGLVGQFVHYNRAELATRPTVGTHVQTLYDKLGKELRANWQISDYRVARHTIVPSDDDAGLLMARATVVNNTAFDRPLPLIRLQLKNRWGDAIYGRVFSPDEYLTESPPGTLAGNGRLEVSLDLVHPAPNEEIGYSFDVCLDTPTGPDCGTPQIFNE